ncbi:MAG: RT0821/Lpp0805 family surface protein [Methyloligella sp. ZOD6]
MALYFLAPAPTSSLAQEQPASLQLDSVPGVSLRGPSWAESPKAKDGAEAPKSADLGALRAKLDESDRKVALKALEIALMQLGDGATLVWKRQKNELSGVIKTISAFRDASGRVCRKVNYSITLGTYERAIVGTACRNHDGNWMLAG